MFARWLAVTLFTMLSGACVELHGYSSVAELRADAARVFKAHNKTAGEVMLLLPELAVDAPAAVELMDADAAMLAACEPLNALAIAQRDGDEPTLAQRRQIPATIEACRSATRDTRRLLDAY